jgi:hypothetical protein
MSDISSFNNVPAGGAPSYAAVSKPQQAKVPAGTGTPNVTATNEIDTVQLTNSSQAPVAASLKANETSFKPDSRKEVVEQAAQQFASQTFYPLSSVRFTIYKSSNGEYVTRFTNLQDGSVNYVPEPELMQNLVRSRQGEPTLVGTYA